MQFKIYKPGDPLQILAAQANAWTDAAIAHKQGGKPGPPAQRPAEQNTGIILVKNMSGAALDNFSLVQVDAPLVLPADNEKGFKREILLTVKKPTAAKLPWGILQEPLAVNRVGRAVISGATICKINLTAKTDDHVDSVTDVLLPKSGSSGPAEILWVAGGVKTATATGEQWAVIRLGSGGGGGGEWRLCSLQGTSGSQGTQTTVNARVYTVKVLGTSAVLATGVTPSHNRVKGLVIDAKYGWCNQAGTAIYLSDEVVDTGC